MRALDDVLYKISRDACIVFTKLYLRVKVSGLQNIPAHGGFIIASNHRSYLDPVVIGSVCPRRINYMARHDLFSVPLFGRLIKAYGTFPVKRGRADLGALRETIRRVNRGYGVLLFPEGTRQAKNALGEAGAGVGFLAAKINGPVVPAFISGTEKAMPKGAKVIRPVAVTVKFGRQISVHEGLPYQDIAADIMRSIGGLA
jgi:1-acyl-sn-glycerol-3-phosphate acyltransferase